MSRMNKVLCLMMILVVAPKVFAMPNITDALEHAKILFEQQAIVDAEQAFLALQETHPNESFYYLGRVKLASNQFDEAEEYLEKALRLEPNSADEYYWYAKINAKQIKHASIFSKLSYANNTEDAFLAAIDKDATHIKAQQGLFYFYLSAPSIAGGSEAKAVRQVRAIEALSSHAAIKLWIDFYLQTGNDEALITYTNTLLERKTIDEAVLFKAGIALQNIKHYDGAFAFFRTLIVIKETKHYAAGLYQIGRTAVFSEVNVDEGIAALQTYLTLEISTDGPDKNWARLRLSQLYMLQGNTLGAKKLIGELKSARISDKDLIKAIRQLRI
ncbi:tetratricopeptide repeat protein [Pseudoalteromonas sp. NJ631]|uniref:tetratricopeptide repeat protein n=1 Tax=Pseudoalteromonas sp. NJ631 TaxID=493915 RepID=UPI0002ED3354|nr:tetratricopeptide repeat protein [Pseudoalteromonas sp. NJ631]